ncbi:helix-turn-helix transcriptional regulator [Fimbriiglobus ruber]|uniref:Transcriptional regulator, AraC family n=1 Tax=Fimbriiglobus ruber TaxID=1908690 RepID=A0A225EEP9_9BACT|nr:AraC family transcriptional regulator [Fimbriiglobus ruber]OWK46757.1 Transcriptional regulator, AraC family [Fimbriiglobus ruber]
MWAVRADDRDPRPWIAGAVVCPALARREIRHTGVGRMKLPFEIVRTKLGGSYFLACFGGEGRVLVDGRWTRCSPGEAFLLPPGTLHAFRGTGREGWDHCWVRYQEAAGHAPLAAAQTPVLAEFDPEPLKSAILGLYHEARGAAHPAAIDHWCDLVHLYVLRFAQPATMDGRVLRLWELVAADLARAWSATDLAAEAHLGEKQLQRLCVRHLGRTPHQHLIWLRMRRAAELLADGAKVGAAAARVGYQNPFVFSSTFKRVIGCSPSEYPARKR